MILIVGATGITGNEICRLLTTEKMKVKAMVRETSDQFSVNNLKELGVEIVFGDLRKSSTLKPILRGIKKVISTASSIPLSYMPAENDPVLVDRNGMVSLIDEAKRTGVKHFTYTSFSGKLDLDFPLLNAKRSVERYLQKSGLTYTIIRSSYFMETWFSDLVGFNVEKAKVTCYGSGKNPVSYISYMDVAKFAVESMGNPAVHNSTLELGGPDNLSLLDAIEIFERISEKKFEVQHVPLETLHLQMNSVTDLMQKSLTGLMYCYAKGAAVDMEQILTIFPVKLKSVEEYATELTEALNIH